MSQGYYWWYIKDVSYGICYIDKNKVIFFVTGQIVRDDTLENCSNMTFIPAIIPDIIRENR